MPLSRSRALPTVGTAAAVKVAGKRLYVATEGGDLLVFDVADAASPKMLGTLVLSAAAHSLEVGETAATKDTIYVGTEGGVDSIDMSKSSSPRLRETWKTDGPVTHLKLWRETLFAVSQGREGPLFYEIGRSGQVRKQDHGAYGTVTALTEIGQELYAFGLHSGGGPSGAICLSSSGGFQLPDDRDASAMVADTAGGASPKGAVFGDRLFTVRDNFLEVHALRGPPGGSGAGGVLAYVGSTGLGPDWSPERSRILLRKDSSGTRLYVLTEGGIEVFDATEPPALPRLLGLYEVPRPRDIAIADDALYVATEAGVHVVPIPDLGPDYFASRPAVGYEYSAEDVEREVLRALEDGDAATVRRALWDSFDPTGALFAMPSRQLEQLVEKGIITSREVDRSGDGPMGSGGIAIRGMSERLMQYRLRQSSSLPFELHEPLYLAIYYSAAYDKRERMVRAVRRLVLNGEDPNYLSPYNSGRTPLAAAMLVADVPEIVTALLRPSDSPRAPRADSDLRFRLDVPDVSFLIEMTPLAALLSIADRRWTYGGEPAMVRALLDRGTDLQATVVTWDGGAYGGGRTERSILEALSEFDPESEIARAIRERIAGDYGAP